TATTSSRGSPSTSAAIEQSEDICPPPTSGAAHRTTAPPSSSMPTHALAESRVQHMRPYGVNDAASPRPMRRGPSPARPGPSAAPPHRLAEHRVALEHLAGGDGVALPEEVPLAELERIHAERRRQRVHLALVRYARLDGPERAVGAGDGIVRVRGDGVDVHVG